MTIVGQQSKKHFQRSLYVTMKPWTYELLSISSDQLY